MIEEKALSPDDLRRTTTERTVLQENRANLFRRWRFTKSREFSDPKLLSRFFPGQQFLLDLLSSMTEAEVKALAETTTPLFTVTFPKGLDPQYFQEQRSYTALELESINEIYMALSVRRDAIMSARSEASVVYGMSPSDVNTIVKFGLYELRALARNPMMTVTPSTSDNYFIAASEREMTHAELAVLAQVSRRNR